MNQIQNPSRPGPSVERVAWWAALILLLGAALIMLGAWN